MIKIFASIILLVPCLLQSQVHEWTRLDGATVKATLSDVSATKARLLLSGNRHYEIPINQLSLADHHVIAQFIKQRDFPSNPTARDNTPPTPSKPEPTTTKNTIRIEAEEIENVFPGSTPAKAPLRPGEDPPPPGYLIESDSSRGTLEMKFPNPLFESAFTTVESLTLVVQNSEGPYAGTKSRISVKRRREELASTMGARRGQRLQFKLDPERFRNRVSIDLELHCGHDAIILLQDPAPHLIVEFKSQ